MLQLALAALLAGSLITGGLDGDDKDKDKKAQAQAQQPIESILVADRISEDDPINDTYALGRTEEIPLKFWVGYGWAQDEEAYDAQGNEGSPFGAIGITEVTAQRAFVGAQLHVLNTTNFSVGVGGQLNVAQNKVTSAVGELDSGFGLQGAKAYGVVRGRTLGIHGGYHFDLGDDGDLATELIPNGEYPNSDQVDAWFVGANFDYPSEVVRLFGGIDYFNRDDVAGSEEGSSIEDDEIVVFNAGAGLRISWVEIGAAALLRTNIGVSRLSAPYGGHQGSVAPYLILAPPSLPVSISVKGAFMSEYADYGYSLGGASDLVTRKGFTVTAALGF